MKECLGVLLFAAAACTACNSAQSKEPVHPASGTVSVVMTAATLQNECGSSGAPYRPPVEAMAPTPERSSMARAGAANAMKVACRQTSMQLTVVSAATSTMAVSVSRVEIFDDAGKSVAVLPARSPMVWSASDSQYRDWDQSVAAGQTLQVSYALGAADWQSIPNRYGKTYVVRATVTVSGKDQTVERKVEVEAPASLPPGVMT